MRPDARHEHSWHEIDAVGPEGARVLQNHDGSGFRSAARRLDLDSGVDVACEDRPARDDFRAARPVEVSWPAAARSRW